MIKNFDIWPLNFEKNNLFEEQKVFLMYLIGQIPKHEDWTINIEYLTKLKEIKKKEIKDFVLPKIDIDLAKMRGDDPEKIRKERFKEEKTKKIKELNEKYSIKNQSSEKEIVNIANTHNNDIEDNNENPKQLWEMLQGKGLIKNGL